MVHPTTPSKFGHSTPHSPDMQHRLLLNWPPFNTLSLGATSLYRRVMAPSLLKVFDEKPTPVKTIEVEVEDKLYHVPELASCRTFDKFDSAFPDLPPKHLHLPSQKVEFLAGDYLEVTGDSAASKILDATTAHSCPPKAISGDVANTVGSCLPLGALEPHSSNEACSKDEPPPACNGAARKAKTNMVRKLDTIEESEEEVFFPILYEEHNDHLRALRTDGTNIVFDSPNPHIAPHIVLSPPPNTWCDYTAAFDNRPPEPQFCCPRLLMIPQYQFFFRSFDRDSFAALPVPSDMDEPFDDSEDEEDEGREDVYDENTPLTYFNLKEFRLSQDIRDDDRLINGSRMDIECWLEIIQRHQCKMNAFLAAEEAPEFRKYWDKPDFVSSRNTPFKWNDLAGHALLAAKKAPEFRKRWDDPEFVSSKDPRFKWYDPAAPIIADYRLSIHRRQTVTIIESDMPCTVPHIVIMDPIFNPWDPWVAYNNAPTNPQDNRFGMRMIIPSMETTITNYELPGNLVAQNDDEDSDSETVSDIISTPIQTQEGLGDIAGESSSGEAGQEFVNLGESTLVEGVSPAGTFPEVERSAFSDEEDEWVPWDTGLPPFDDWYTSTKSV